MPMTHAIIADTALTMAAAALPIAIVASDTNTPLDALAASAGISGAVVAGLKSHILGVETSGKPIGRGRWCFATLSGATVAVWCGPAVVEYVGWGLRGSYLVHFILGLTGSSLCDIIAGLTPRLFRKKVEDTLGIRITDIEQKPEQK